MAADGSISPLVVLTGASGSGKTTLARAVSERYPDRCSVFFFDSIGVPSSEEMQQWGDGHQPGGAWQRAMTLQWFHRLAAVLETGRSVLFEGQMRPAFIREALGASGISVAHVILIDCDNHTREQRLILNRRQPGLADEHMIRWADYLRREAIDAGYEILDTSSRSFSDCVEHLHSRLTLPVPPNHR
jgi:predicted kinase